MKSYTPSSLFACFLLLFGIVASVFTPLMVQVTAQNTPPAGCPPTYPVACATPNPKTKLDTWPLGAEVTVNIDPSFGPAHTSAIEQVFRNWQIAGGPNGNGSSVTFSFTHHATPPSMNPPPGTYNAQVWNRAPPQNPSLAGGIEATDNGTNAVAQEIWINPQATDPCATAQTTAHEIGHGFGLDECPNCPPDSSVMVEGNNGYNSLNGTYGPTTCDNARVRSVAQYPKSKTTSTGGGGGAGNIQPYNYYECTTYWWVLYYSWDDGQTWIEQDRWEAGCW